MTRPAGSTGLLPRRAVLAAGAALAASPAAWAQEAGRTYRLGALYVAPRSTRYLVALFEELRRGGFIEGRNLSIMSEWGVTPDRADAAAAAVVKAAPDVIYTVGPVLTRAVQRATKTIPILTLSGDLVAEKLVASLAHPGGNTTGVSFLAPELDGKRQDLLIDMLPGVRRLAALVDPNTTPPTRLQALAEAAGSRDVALSIHRADRPEEIVPAIDAARAAGAQALNVLSSSLFFVNHAQIMERAAMVRLPAMYESPEYADEGALVAYGSTLMSIIRRHVASLLVKLLRRAKPADTPAEQPTVFELVVNLKTAKALGLEIPTNFLIRADKVIE